MGSYNHNVTSLLCGVEREGEGIEGGGRGGKRENSNCTDELNKVMMPQFLIRGKSIVRNICRNRISYGFKNTVWKVRFLTLLKQHLNHLNSCFNILIRCIRLFRWKKCLIVYELSRTVENLVLRHHLDWEEPLAP